MHFQSYGFLFTRSSDTDPARSGQLTTLTYPPSVFQLFPVGSTREEINRIYRKLAILLHPDKTGLPGADDAFKLLGVARRNLLALADR